MHDALSVGVVERTTHFGGQAENLRHLRLLVLDVLVERESVDQLHRVVADVFVDPAVVDAGDVGMIQPLGDANFAGESIEHLFGRQIDTNDFERDAAARIVLHCFPNGGKRAFADQPFDFVAGMRGSAHSRGGTASTIRWAATNRLRRILGSTGLVR